MPPETRLIVLPGIPDDSLFIASIIHNGRIGSEIRIAIGNAFVWMPPGQHRCLFFGDWFGRR